MLLLPALEQLAGFMRRVADNYSVGLVPCWQKQGLEDVIVLISYNNEERNAIEQKLPLNKVIGVAMNHRTDDTVPGMIPDC
jgi:hypothetical protein